MAAHAVVLLASAIMRIPERNIHKEKEPTPEGRLLKFA
jgi:hypothetical protein